MSLKWDNEKGYYARIYTNGRGSRRIQKNWGHISSKDAKKAYAKWVAENLGDKPEGNEKGYTLSQCTERFLESNQNKMKAHTARITKDVYLKQHWIPFFGDIEAEALTPLMVERYRTHRLSQPIGKKGKTISNGTVNREVNTLNGVLNKAVTNNMISENPVGSKRVEALPEHNRLAFFSRDEWKRFTAALLDTEALLARAEGQERMKVEKWRNFYLGNYERALPLFQTMLLVCGRLSEVTRLNWFDISLERKKIVIHQYKINNRKGDPDKHLDINPELYAILKSMEKEKDASGLVFKRQDGSEWDGEYLDRVFKTALKVANIEKNYCIHQIRHTGASWMVQAGVPIFDVSKMLGHSNIKTTMKYAHLAPKQLDAPMTAITTGVWIPKNVTDNVATNEVKEGTENTPKLREVK